MGGQGLGDRQDRTIGGRRKACEIEKKQARATEEEECDGCNGADPRRRLNDSHLILANGILLRSIAATTVGAAAAAESGDRDDVDACDRYRRIVHWAGGLGGQQRQQRRNRGR